MAKRKLILKSPATLALRGSGYTQAHVAKMSKCNPYAVTMVLQGKYENKVSASIVLSIKKIIMKLTGKKHDELWLKGKKK